jgi:hypothetical protein
MEYRYQIILFKNKIKKKIIKKFKTKTKAGSFYDKLIKESNHVIFPKFYENGNESKFDLCLIENSPPHSLMNIRDEIGRNVSVKLDDSNYSILKLSHYNIEELFLDFQTKKKITTYEFIQKYLNSSGIKLISKLNNKIILQNDLMVNLFTFKNNIDSNRFIDGLTKYLISINKNDCMIVRDTSISQRKYLYEILEKNGYSKSYLFRHSTTHLK